MVISVGEILADMIAKNTAEGTVYSRHAGGAPFNVACGIAKLGGKAGFYGCVGKDLIGDFLIGFAKTRGIERLHIERNRERNTTLAFVDLSEAGERSFCFYRKNTADFCLDEEAIPRIVGEADIVHLGSLPLSEERGRKFADGLIEKAKEKGALVSFDVNYRDDVYPDPKEAVRVYSSYIAAADIVKFSEQELYDFSGEREEKRAVRKMSKGKHLFVTLGKRGSLYCHDGGEILHISAPDLKPVDTTGAGDAYYAGVLKVLDEKGFSAVAEAMATGSVCGTLATQKKGAIESFPSPEEIKPYLDKLGKAELL